MSVNLKKNHFIVTFSILLLLTPFFYYIFSIFVIINCERSKVFKYIFTLFMKYINQIEKFFVNYLN